MSPTTKRICRIAVTLRPDKVYTITLDHCIENLVPQRLTGYLIPLVRYYWGFDKAECLTPNDEALKDLINQLRIYYQSQELSQKIGESLKR